MDDLCPILVYDTKQRHLNYLTEEQARNAVSQLTALLRTHSLSDLEEVLMHWFSIPRNVTYFLPRFHVENFGALDLLGTGGFGTVHKAMHRIDNKQYAIKIIRGCRSRTALNLARAEVGMMARLNHENIIQYVTSWIEYDIPGSSSDSDYPSPPTPPESTSTDDLIVFQDEDDDSPPEYQQSSTHPTVDSDVYLDPNLNRHQLAIPNASPLYKNSTPYKNLKPQPSLFIQMELCRSNLANWLRYRNSQISATSIAGSDRSSCPISIHLDSLVSHGPARWLADQIARGVAYLHSEHLLHRDLKPENVLLCGPPLERVCTKPCDCRPGRPVPQICDSQDGTWGDVNRPCCYHQFTVKICDFGLARFWKRPDGLSRRFKTNESDVSANATNGTDWPSNHSRHLSGETSDSCSTSYEILKAISNSKLLQTQSEYTPTSMSSLSTTTSSSDDIEWSLMQMTHPTYDLLTANLGSTIYSAPETIAEGLSTRTVYDHKADVYSMGVIFLQLFHPFQTLHELIDTLRMVTDQTANSSTSPSDCLPHNFTLSWAEESLLVHRMLSKQPEFRPSVLEVLHLLAPTSEFPDLGSHQDTFRADEENSSTLHNSTQSIEALDDTHSNGSPHVPSIPSGNPNQAFDLLLHRNRQLELKVIELTQRLSLYEEV